MLCELSDQSLMVTISTLGHMNLSQVLSLLSGHGFWLGNVLLYNEWDLLLIISLNYIVILRGKTLMRKVVNSLERSSSYYRGLRMNYRILLNQERRFNNTRLVISLARDQRSIQIMLLMLRLIWRCQAKTIDLFFRRSELKLELFNDHMKMISWSLDV